MKISIIIPVFNEKETIEKVIKKVFEAPCLGLEKEIIVVDDGSFDGTREILKNLQKVYNFILINYPKGQKNQGKGAAIQTSLKFVTGDFVLIQDADLEYDFNDYNKLLSPLIKGEAEIVYGSRNLKDNPHSSLFFSLGGKFITSVFNLLFGTKLTDINTCYKVFKSEIIKNIKLESRDFAFCEEVTAKVVKKGYKIKEVPINYYSRSFKEGKKIRVKDGFIALWVILKNRLT